MKIWERWSPLTGVLSVICSVVGTLLVLGQPQDSDSDSKIVAYFASHSHRVQGVVGLFVFLAGILLLLTFLGTLRERLAAAEGGAARLSALGFGAGVASAVIWVVSMLIARADSFAAGTTSKFHVDPNTYRMFADTAYFGWVAATLVGALVVWATSAVALRTKILPRWFGRLGILVGISQLFGIFFFPFFVWWSWLVATSILLVVRPARARASLAISAT
jgi:hypothetical protein